MGGFEQISDVYRQMAVDLDEVDTDLVQAHEKVKELEARRVHLQRALEGMAAAYPVLTETTTAVAPGSFDEPPAEPVDLRDEAVAATADDTVTFEIDTPATGTGMEAANGTKPMPGKRAVLTLLREDPGRWWLISDMVQAAIDRGWYSGTVDDNTNRLRIATIRLTDDGIVERESEKHHHNAYRYRLALGVRSPELPARNGLSNESEKETLPGATVG